MLSTKRARLFRNILLLAIVATVSIFFFARRLPNTNLVIKTIESVEDSRETVMRFSAAALSASLAITALPDDFATPLADTLADMNIYFVAILMILLLERILLLYGFKLTFLFLIPAACVIGSLSVLRENNMLKSLAIRVSVLGLSLAFVVPISTLVTNYVAEDYIEYVETTIVTTEGGADKLNEAMNSGDEEKTIFEKLSELFQTAINGLADLMRYFQNTIRMCMNSLAILFLTNCLMPILNFFLLKWILKETFHVAIPTPQFKRKRHAMTKEESNTTESELVAIGE